MKIVAGGDIVVKH